MTSDTPSDTGLSAAADAQFTLWGSSLEADSSLPFEWEAAVGETLRAIREEQGWSQAFAVDRLREVWGMDIHQTTLAKLEAGRRPIRLAELLALSTLYGHSVMTVLRRQAAISDVQPSGASELDDWFAARQQRAEAGVEASLEYLRGAILSLGGELAQLSAAGRYVDAAARMRGQAARSASLGQASDDVSSTLRAKLRESGDDGEA